MPEAAERELTLGQLIATSLVLVRRHWLRFGLAGLGFGALGLGLTLLIPVEYRAEASILPPARCSNVGSMLSRLGAMTGIPRAGDDVWVARGQGVR